MTAWFWDFVIQMKLFIQLSFVLQKIRIFQSTAFADEPIIVYFKVHINNILILGL